MGPLRAQLARLSPGTVRVLGNTGWLMADRVLRLGVGLLVGVWVARYLGPAQFGILSFALAFNGLFSTITALGLEGIVIRHLVVQVAEAAEVLGTAFALRLAASVIAALLSAVAIHWLDPGDSRSLLLVGILSIGLLFQAFDTIDAYFQSQVQSKLTVWAKNAAFIVVAVGRIALIELKAPLWTFAVAQVVEMAVGALGLVVMYRWAGQRLSQWRALRSRALALLRQSWPVLLAGMAVILYMRIDIVMLKFMQGDRAVGIYATAARISEVWYFVPTAIISSVSPAIIRVKDDPQLFQARIERLFTAMSLMSLCVGAVIALGAPWIVRTLYTSSFSAAAPVLAVHVWTSVFVFLGVAQSPWDLSRDLLKLGFYRTLAGAVANILLNLVLIPRYSVMGAAFATVISQAIASVFANAVSVRTRPVFFLQIRSICLLDLWRPLGRA